MELIRGQTLTQILSGYGTFSASEATIIGQEVCRALAAVHAAGIVHKDLKAQNVMRESGGRFVLMDFGAGGTPVYLAPEVLSGAEATVASDIYALGVLLFYLVTRKYPASGASLDDLRQAHARGERRRLVDEPPICRTSSSSWSNRRWIRTQKSASPPRARCSTRWAAARRAHGHHVSTTSARRRRGAHCRASVCRDQCGEAPRLLLRRDCRRDHQCADRRAWGARGGANVGVSFFERHRRRATSGQRARCRLGARGQRPRVWRTSSGDCAARGHGRWQPAMVAALRLSAGRCVRRAGQSPRPRRGRSGCAPPGR